MEMKTHYETKPSVTAAFNRKKVQKYIKQLKQIGMACMQQLTVSASCESINNLTQKSKSSALAFFSCDSTQALLIVRFISSSPSV